MQTVSKDRHLLGPRRKGNAQKKPNVLIGPIPKEQMDDGYTMWAVQNFVIAGAAMQPGVVIIARPHQSALTGANGAEAPTAPYTAR